MNLIKKNFKQNPDMMFQGQVDFAKEKDEVMTARQKLLGGNVIAHSVPRFCKIAKNSVCWILYACLWMT